MHALEICKPLAALLSHPQERATASAAALRLLRARLVKVAASRWRAPHLLKCLKGSEPPNHLDVRELSSQPHPLLLLLLEDDEDDEDEELLEDDEEEDLLLLPLLLLPSATQLDLRDFSSHTQLPPLLLEDADADEAEEPLPEDEEDEEAEEEATHLEVLLLSSQTQLPLLLLALAPLLLLSSPLEVVASVPKQDLRWSHLGLLGAPAGQGIRRHLRPITPTFSEASFWKAV